MEDDPKPTPSETSGLSAFWRELRRRKVVRIALVYAVVAWLLIQVSATVFPQFDIPPWGTTFVTLLLAIGFPIALIMAWAFEVTPEGIKTASDIQTGGSVAPAKGNRLNYVILGLVVIVLLFQIVDRYLFDNPSSSQLVNQSNGSSQLEGSALNKIKRTVINLKEGNQLAFAEKTPLSVGRRSLDLSSDGEQLVYVVHRGDTSQLYLRRMDEFEAQPIAGTEGAFGPFFSPNGQWIGYLTETQVMKVSVRGGDPQAIVEAGNVDGAAWNRDDMIVLAEREGAQLSMVSATGGEKRILLKGTSGYTEPEFLPDGRGILLTERASMTPSIVLFRQDTGEIVTLIERASNPRFLPSGHILYVDDSGIAAVPFDQLTYAITGTAVPVLKDVRRENNRVSQLALSEDGCLVYVPGEDMGISTPTWVDRSGIEEMIPLLPQRYGTLSLSPDNSQFAFLIIGPATDVWLFDFERATSPRRLTIGGNKMGMNWSPDGQNIAFVSNKSSNQVSNSGIFQQRVAGGPVEQIVSIPDGWSGPNSWMKNHLFVFTAPNEDLNNNSDIWVMRLGDEGEAEPFVSTSASEWGASMSPDGRFIAYTSDESGEFQIYVKQYPPTNDSWEISTGYGEEPIWSARGDEIFYRRGQEWLSVPVQTDPHFDAGVPEVIFKGPYNNVSGISYDVTANGQRFLVLKSPDQPPATKIHVVTNWFEELNRLVPPTDD